jgi:hypothetical protein
VLCQQLAGLVVGIHEDRVRIIRNGVIRPVVGLLVFQPKINVFEPLVLSDVSAAVILNALRVFPQPPRQDAKLRVFEERLVVSLGSAVTVITPDRLPVEIVAVDLVHHSCVPMPGACGARAVGDHGW